MLALTAAGILAFTGIACWIHLLHGTIANQAVRIANLEHRLCQVEAMQRAAGKQAVLSN